MWGRRLGIIKGNYDKMMAGRKVFATVKKKNLFYRKWHGHVVCAFGKTYFRNVHRVVGVLIIINVSFSHMCLLIVYHTLRKC